MFDILSFQSTIYFAFGQPQKTSLIAEFCRENHYQHLHNPTLETLQQPRTVSAIVEAPIDIFHKFQPLRPSIQAIFVGTVFTEEELKLKRDYKKIGKCIEVPQFSYELFRKAVYPNLIFFYGPINEQNVNCAHALASQIGYLSLNLPPNANSFMSDFKKTVNYVVSGLFTQKSQLQILEQFFNIKVIHLKYNRIDLPGSSEYFDKEFELLNFLKSKPYYHSVNGLYNQIKIIDDVSEMLSPTLIYCQLDDQLKESQEYQAQRAYLEDYLNRNEQKALILHLDEVVAINKRKGIFAPQNSFQKTILLNQILYRDFNIKQAFILKFPSTLNEVLNFESDNRNFEAFVDLGKKTSLNLVEEFTAPMYFLQNQLRIVPNTYVPLERNMQTAGKYWLMHGIAGSGKTTVAKFLAAQYGFKLIEYESYFASVKQKLIAPEDGEEVPLRKIVAHFKTVLTQNANDTYIIDGLPFENKDLEEWIKVIGPPSLVKLDVDIKESILRTRKKNQGDLKEQIKQEQLAKANESQSKVDAWMSKISSSGSVREINALNYNGTVIQSQKLIHQLFKKNVFLVQWHNSLTFQNVALRYNMALINLHMTPLRESLQQIRKISNRNLILCYYNQEEEKLVSEDLYWIEKNIGTIRYLAINEPEELTAHEEKIALQRPKAAQKVKVEGAEGEQKPAEEQSAEKKDVFDIYAYEWTKPSNPKNLSQWFMKSKKRVEKIESGSGKQVLEKWQDVMQVLQKSEDTAVYHRFK